MDKIELIKLMVGYYYCFNFKTIIREDLTNKFNEIVCCDLITINRKLIISVLP